MKPTLLAAAFAAATFGVRAQVEDPFQEAFKDMFELVEHPYVPQGAMDVPPPPGVPLDGGLTALLVAGGGLAYRKLRSNSAQKATPNQLK
jgi:hypothetical protein